MQNFTDTQWQTHGCFVYHITSNAGIGVRSSLNVGDDNRTDFSFEHNDLVSVDLIRPSRVPDSENGPFLRLSDNSGWIFEKKYGKVLAERLPVEKGLWAFYVDNDGTMLRSHPYTETPIFADYSTRYEPMQLLHCDRRVVSPATKIASYRVQGTDAWVVEKNKDGTAILIPEHTVKVGMFAYEVVKGSCDITLCNEPSVGESTQLPVSFEAGEIVICDVIRQSPYGPSNGPFLRLDDGWGWVYEQLSDTPNCRMRQIPIEKGSWTLKVKNSPVGIAMRRHPMDRNDVRTSTEFEPGSIIRCDRKIKSSGSASFYRVTGKDGWVFDIRDTTDVMMQLVSSQPITTDNTLQTNGRSSWSIDFVRGLALAFELKEIMHNEASRVISFRTDANERINVYYTTRTVGTALNHPHQGTTQLFRRKCTDEELREIMQNPRVHTGKGYKKRSRVDGHQGSVYGQYNYEVDEDEFIDEEEDYRNKLLDYEKEKEKISVKEMRALKVLKSIDDERANDAAKMKVKMDARADEFEQIQREKEEAKRKRQRQKKAAEDLERCTCNVCHQVFANAHAKNQHYEAVHCFRCDFCYKDFNSRHALNQHKDSLGHW